MYRIKPILDTDMVTELPTCMYSMKSIDKQPICSINNQRLQSASGTPNCLPLPAVDVSHKSSKNPLAAIEQQVNHILKRSDANEIEQLEKRQERILTQLKELKAKLMSMHKELNICHKPAQPRQTATEETDGGKIQPKPIDTKFLHDIVINANPNSIPYTLLAMRKLWQQRLAIRVHVFTHSTISQDLPADVQNFTAQLNTPSINGSATIPALNVSLIWKNVKNIELIASPTSCPIVGESNLLRYLMRIGPNELNYEQYPDECCDIDGTLDLCLQLSRCKSAKDCQQILKFVSMKLGKQQYFGGAKVSIADIAVGSAIKQTEIIKELPPTLAKWWTNANDIVFGVKG